ncbi:MAG: hypothetical protein JWQ57_3446 [Mucilaginibacter sp.]|nr:hypothetical protein [Mucilaginibacter sp.]
MRNTIKITWYFYKSISLWCLITSLACAYYVLPGKINVVESYIFKLMGYGLAAGFQYIYQNANRTFFYFRNAGYSIDNLYIYSFVSDAVAYGIFISISKLVLYWAHIF